MYLSSLNMLRVFVEKFKPTKVFFILDGPDAGERRRQLYPNYKGKKRIVGRESKVTIMEGDENIAYGVEGAFQNQLIQLHEFLKLLPVTVCMVPYCEGDDMIAYLALKNKDEFENIIISNDKDYLQLIQKGISVYRWRTKILYDEERFLQEFKILPNNYIFRKILLGDTSDVIEGIKGIGEKTFAKLNEGLAERNYGNSVGEFLEFIDGADLSTCTTRERNAILKILENDTIEKLVLLFDIMKLSKNCMMKEQIEIMGMQIEEQKKKTLLKMSAKNKMSRTYFNRLYNGFDDEKWIHPFSFLPPNVEVRY